MTERAAMVGPVALSAGIVRLLSHPMVKIGVVTTHTARGTDSGTVGVPSRAASSDAPTAYGSPREWGQR
ncbi:hypothetical protein [Streptomyces sp. NPDC060035]|uniref:hypothetical protein n=1 Tax=Streptomyces sp. NPDC060035 TaxID=3347044 RepID=UPI003690CE8A